MYDTNFFIQTYPLKQRILAREFCAQEAHAVYNELAAGLAARPFVFNIETTNHCNMRCLMCQRTTDHNVPLQHMDMEVFSRVAEQLAPQQPADMDRWDSFVQEVMQPAPGPCENNFYFDVVSRCVTLHGFGEPLLDPLLPQRVELLTKYSVPSYFSANPNNIRLDVMEQLFEVGAGYVKFAMDSLDDARAREIRGPRCDFSKAYDLLRQTLELKKRKNASTVIVMTMLDFSGETGPDSEPAKFLELFANEDVYAYVKSVDNKWLLAKKGEEDKTRGGDNSHYSRQYCEYPFTSLTVMADGSVVPCTQDINSTWTFGNVMEQPLEEIWRSEKLREFRRMHVEGRYDADFMCHAQCDQNMATYFINND